jgi:hypothetical protein
VRIGGLIVSFFPDAFRRNELTLKVNRLELAVVLGPALLKKLRAPAKIAGVVAMLGLLIFLGGAASSETLHRVVCPDAGQPAHHCAVTSFAAGSLDVPVVALMCPAPQPIIFYPTYGRDHAPHLSIPLFHLSPCHGPPANS